MTRRQQRLAAIGLILSGFALAAGLALFALRDTVTFFYGPSELKARVMTMEDGNRPVRLGGLVKSGSIRRDGDSIRFEVTDGRETVDVLYRGIAPDLFKEDSGVVATGRYENALFEADQLLAKHDENYMPPDVARTLKDAHDRGKAGME